VSIQVIGGADPDTVMLLNMNGEDGSTDIRDTSKYRHTVTAHNSAALDVGEKQFGSASCDFSASSAYLSIPDHDTLDFTTGDFTIEGWIYPSSGAGDDFFLSKGTSTKRAHMN
jgi:hypothetical protein